MGKAKPVDIEGLLQLKNMLQALKETATGAIAVAQHVQTSVDGILADNNDKLQAHLERVDLRPKLTVKPLPKNQWAITLGKSLYYLGPKANFETLDDDEPKFYWYLDQETQTPENVIKHDAKSLFQALVSVMQDYCNVGEA